MKLIANFFINNSKFTTVLTVGVFIFGLFGLMRMNAESYPAVSMATATVITGYDGATISDVETKITKPLEDEIRTVTGLKDVKSTSQAGLSKIVIRVDMDNPRVDVKETMADIQRAIDRTTDLPFDLRDPPKFTELKSEEFPVFEVAIVGSNENRARDLLADHFKEDIEDNKDIKGVRLVGFAKRAFQIRLDPTKMQANYIATDEVISKLRSRNTNISGGELKDTSIQQLVRIEGKIKDAAELEKIVLRSNFTGKTIYLKDIATVDDSEEEIKTKVKYNGKPATIAIITKKAGADTLKMVEAISLKINEYQKRYPEFKFKVYNNEALKVKNRVEVLANNAFSGLILVVVFLFFFLPGKIGMAASMSLPIAVLATMGFMPSFQMNIDAITVLALVIALGMLVDNSVVISENFTRLRQDGLPPKEAAVQSIGSLWLPITATALTTIAAFLPMLVTRGIMGQFIKWIPVVVTMSLVLSLFESFFLLPMRLTIAGKFIKRKVEGVNTDWFNAFEHKFERFMSVLIKRRYLVGIVFFSMIMFSFFMMIKANKFILFPAEETELYIARVEMPKGTILEETNRRLSQISTEVSTVLGKDMKHLVSRAGVSTMGLGDPKSKEGNNVGMISIYVSDHAKYNIPHTEILKKLRTIKPDYVENLSFQELINGPPVGNAIEATFRSNDLETLEELVTKIKTKLSAVKGIKDLQIDNVIGDNEVHVDINYEKADRLGLNLAQIGDTVRTAVNGNRVANVNLLNKKVDIIVRLSEDTRGNIEDLKNINILDRMGNLVPLGSFVDFHTIPGKAQIKRFDFKRSKTLTGNVEEEIITSVAANKELLMAFDELKVDYPGVSLSFGGAAESTKESMESLFQALFMSLIGIFALLVFVFNSFVRPGIIMTTIPLGLFGFSIAFYFHERPISFLALIGIIGLGGIIVNSGIVLISFIDQMRDEGKMSLNEILVKASGIRLRAVLVTSLTTISGLLPTAYGIGGSDAMLVPMTLAMAWGLTSGTILTLIWVPCAYAILEDINDLLSKIVQKLKPSKDYDIVSEGSPL